MCRTTSSNVIMDHFDDKNGCHQCHVANVNYLHMTPVPSLLFYTHVCIHTHARTHMHAHTRTHTHTHKHVTYHQHVKPAGYQVFDMSLLTLLPGSMTYHHVSSAKCQFCFVSTAVHMSLLPILFTCHCVFESVCPNMRTGKYLMCVCH